MTPAELLRELARRGVKLTVNGDCLRYEAPQGALTPELLAAMREHKAELLARLSVPDFHPGDRVQWLVDDGHSYGTVVSDPRFLAANEALPAAWTVQLHLDDGREGDFVTAYLRKVAAKGGNRNG